MSKETKAAPAETAQQTAPAAAEQQQIHEGPQGAAPAPEEAQEAGPEEATEGTQEENQEGTQGAEPAAKEQTAPLAARLKAAQDRAADALNELCSLMRNEVGRPILFPVQALQVFKFVDDPAAPFQPAQIELEREPFQPQPIAGVVPHEVKGPQQISTDHSLRTRKAINIQAPGAK